jgi:Ca2+/Na+ antiporter
MINKFPLMHNNIQHRLKSVNEKNKLTTTESYDPDNVEAYPLRDYLKVEVFFKLFLFFILFGSHVKGYNIPFFISMLIVYYWYCLYTDMVAYYDKKINEFKLTPEEQKELNFLDDEDAIKDFENEEEGEENSEQDDSGENSLHQEETIQQNIEREDTTRQRQIPQGDVNELLEENEANINKNRDYFERDKIQSDSKIDDIHIEEIDKLDNEVLAARGKYFTETQNLQNKENIDNKDNLSQFQNENRKSSSLEKESPQEMNHIISKAENKKSKQKEKKRESVFK